MKLLLTSGGLTNTSITQALFEIVGKKPNDTVVAFIPTAANVEKECKEWLVDDLYRIKEQGLKCLDIVDISALPLEVFLPRLEAADVLFFGGGNTSYLMDWLERSGLKKRLPDLLKTRVWAGISAGSIVTAPSLHFSSKDKKLYYEEEFGHRDEHALSFVNFHVRPHLNSPYFSDVRKDILETIVKEVSEPVYALDDQSAITVTDGKVEVISEGEYVVFNGRL